ncbi:MAG: threonylcarbamoyl-AMP synthase [Omnitrophica WOR_2 bacterium RIFCSPHIGHO2_02_FULL_52_10]|nr:MAG: threonylcarbamoyl-AMP synthase [Omnitrophica WOR_2 bacterium RIFCSPHIGHO2_02_FULL_52_10]
MKTEIIKLDPQFPDLRLIARCAKVIRSGGLVGFPTETVYGIAADYSNPAAMERLRTVKKRDKDKPFSVLVAQAGLIANYTPSSDPKIYKLIDAFWPGPLTLVVPALEDGKTIGVRMPDHPIALKLVQESQCTIASPSANYEGNDPPKTCTEALKDLDGQIDMIIDGGTSRIGIGSSVVDVTKEKPAILREGVITQKDIDRVTGKKTVLFVCTGNSCRSVMAEYLLKSKMQGREDVEVISAGTGVYLRSTASSETIAVLKEEGIDAAAHIARPVNTVLLKKSDLIIVMTRAHRDQVLERVPAVEKRVYMLKEFSSPASNGQSNIDVPDPIGQPRGAYQVCLRDIKEAVNKIAGLV